MQPSSHEHELTQGLLMTDYYQDVDLANPYADFAVNRKYWQNLKQRRGAAYTGPEL